MLNLIMWGFFQSDPLLEPLTPTASATIKKKEQVKHYLMYVKSFLYHELFRKF